MYVAWRHEEVIDGSDGKDHG